MLIFESSNRQTYQLQTLRSNVSDNTDTLGYFNFHLSNLQFGRFKKKNLFNCSFVHRLNKFRVQSSYRKYKMVRRKSFCFLACTLTLLIGLFVLVNNFVLVKFDFLFNAPSYLIDQDNRLDEAYDLGSKDQPNYLNDSDDHLIWFIQVTVHFFSSVVE
jgi:hypothetical protein